jgi:hypothetical protein
MLRYNTALFALIGVELVWCCILGYAVYFNFEVDWQGRLLFALLFHALTVVSMISVLKKLKQDSEEGDDIWIKVTFGFFIISNFVCINGFLLFRPLVDWFSI